MIKTLREYIKEAEGKGIAIGHFNISNMEGLHGIYNASKKLSEETGSPVPIIIGVSEGEEEFIGRDEVAVLVKMIRERDNYPIFLNADHHYTFESVKKALEAGYDAAILDAVKLPLEENIILTKKCVEYAKELGDKEGRDILIEAELGFIGQSSKLLDAIPEGVSEATMTKPEDAKYFVEQTDINLLAPSVGNIHGMIKGGNPRLDIERIKAIREACGVPLVLHGGSGIADEDFTSAIKAGISIIHINTEIRVAYKNALEKSLKENPNEVAPYKFLKGGVEAVEDVVYNRLKLFNNL
ncbi:MAG: Ketose-bisphosphate aldolase, class-II [Candidatus Nomurabacteria bacterium GW2011_GWF2_35_66]|uniref:Ketose-bisphosphate aldolase, class-II n=1 Tax=Candidatus Nomurabacteria bacterium GW2011_GWE1_35_16 TaxID=1618761 RepID=A0A0G0BBA2_9BACT|nr:MAG: Ketose-bisphosphate aldolase, class-II [Candidatus Nomurabacteria bacterium GW2011_GWF1_34_20]KKP63392.1 MAG: Ketose-bisphosphate aldolase, class-II [Candidatus Nomurabacteria bacterium GW2011_GWE2_34_25]KKP66584.1 MAG: Ketose-bisphosphate aldolase, class-II [Candidatus Nomurabacteria bacterium GW2011_GWE1_35_16]KKP83630.1 MAG: Ketose-bisphosphate aldolase, class-II [Candidatus Nomurabacteria bacterium GW2011_GWF2_35_66]HAE36890.1 tagatose-bisphosphate aldolase [Candidatus Nomurabacteri